MPKPKKIKSTPQRQPIFWIRQIVLAGLIVWVASGVVWWTRIYGSPRRVFHDMLSNNLSTTSYTKVTSMNQEPESIQQSTQVSFVDQVTSRSVVLLQQKGQTGAKSSVKTESIGTSTHDYSRYLDIQTAQTSDAKKPDYRRIQGTWAKSDSSETTKPQYLRQTLLSLLPFGNLQQDNRTRALTALVDSNAYSVDYNNVKQEKVNGKTALVYLVKIDLARYVTAFNNVAKSAGYSDLVELSSDAYQNTPPVEAKIAVSKTSHRLLRIVYQDGQQTEDYTSFGLRAPIDVPKTDLSILDLQKQIRDLQ